MENVDPSAMAVAYVLSIVAMLLVGSVAAFAWNALSSPDPHAWICGYCREKFRTRGAFIQHECKRGFVDS